MKCVTAWITSILGVMSNVDITAELQRVRNIIQKKEAAIDETRNAVTESSWKREEALRQELLLLRQEELLLMKAMYEPQPGVATLDQRQGTNQQSGCIALLSRHWVLADATLAGYQLQTCVKSIVLGWTKLGHFLHVCLRQV